jgi:hypothetical protein
MAFVLLAVGVAGHRDLGAEGMECPSVSPRCGFLSDDCLRSPSWLSFLSVLLTVYVIPAILIGGILFFVGPYNKHENLNDRAVCGTTKTCDLAYFLLFLKFWLIFIFIFNAKRYIRIFDPVNFIRA